MAYKDLSEKEKHTEMLNLLSAIADNTSGGGGGGGSIMVTTQNYISSEQTDPIDIVGGDVYDATFNLNDGQSRYFDPAPFMNGEPFNYKFTVGDNEVVISLPMAMSFSYAGIHNLDPISSTNAFTDYVLCSADYANAIHAYDNFSLTMYRSSSITKTYTGTVYLVPLIPVSATVRALTDIRYSYRPSWSPTTLTRNAYIAGYNFTDGVVVVANTELSSVSTGTARLYINKTQAQLNDCHFYIFSNISGESVTYDDTKPYLGVFVENGYTLQALFDALPNGVACFARAFNDQNDGSYEWTIPQNILDDCQGFVERLVTQNPKTAALDFETATNVNSGASMDIITMTETPVSDYLSNSKIMTMQYDNWEEPELSGEYPVLLGINDPDFDLNKISSLQAQGN